MQKQIAEMSLEEKIGQLFMVDFAENKISGELIQLLTTYHVGGVHLQNVKFNNRKQLDHLNKYMQYYAGVANPLFIAADINDAPLAKGLISSPNQQTLERLNNRLYTRQVATVAASQLRALGVNMGFSPCLQVKGGDSKEIDRIAKHGVAIIQGLQKENVSAIASFFPVEDEIDLLPRYSYDSPKSNLYPFYKAIEEQVDVIQLSEVSAAVTKGLRDELHFSGMIMYNLTAEETIIEDALDALHVGVNMLILPGGYKQQINVLNYVLEAVKKNAVAIEQIDKSLEKILTVKAKRQLDKILPYDEKIFGTFFARSVAEKVAAKIAQLDN